MILLDYFWHEKKFGGTILIYSMSSTMYFELLYFWQKILHKCDMKFLISISEKRIYILSLTVIDHIIGA